MSGIGLFFSCRKLQLDFFVIPISNNNNLYGYSSPLSDDSKMDGLKGVDSNTRHRPIKRASLPNRNASGKSEH